MSKQSKKSKNLSIDDIEFLYEFLKIHNLKQRLYGIDYYKIHYNKTYSFYYQNSIKQCNRYLKICDKINKKDLELLRQHFLYYYESTNKKYKQISYLNLELFLNEMFYLKKLINLFFKHNEIVNKK